MITLAEIASSSPTFTPGQLATFLGIVLFLLGLVIAWKKAFGHEPPLHKEYVTKAEHEKLEEKLESESAKQASSRKGIYKEIENQGRDIASLKTETASQTRQLHLLDGKVDRILERMPRSSS